MTMSPQPQPPGWGTYQQLPHTVSPQRDSTRVIAIIALVVSGVTLVAVVATTLLPLLLFGAFATTLGEDLEDDFGESMNLSSTTTYLGGEVDPAADGSIAGPALAAAVVPMVSEGFEDGMAERTSCDPVARVAKDVSVLCRASDPTWYGIVRFTDDAGGFEVIGTGSTQGQVP
jgi:hypothetical protein